MFGNSENDGFLDGLVRAIANIVSILLIVGIIWLIYEDIKKAYKEKNLSRLFLYLIIFSSIIMFYLISEHNRVQNLISPETPYIPEY